MKAHRFDPLSFVFGATFIALSVVLTTQPLAVTGLRLRWLGAIFLLVLGLVLVATSRNRSGDDT